MTSTADMEPGAEAAWLLRLHEKTVAGIRRHGLPALADGELAVRVPSLMEQARAMRKLDTLPPGKNTPGGVIAFDD